MINKVILVGNVGTDPEVRTTEAGVKVANLRLATTERIFDRQNNTTKEHTEWHTIVLWRGLADVVDRFVRKGSQIYIEGSLRSREWTDRENQKHFSVEMVANDMKLLGRRSENGNGGERLSNGGGYQQQGSGYGQPQGGYQQPAQQYGQPSQPQGYAPAPAPQPAPVTPPAEDPDDLPF